MKSFRVRDDAANLSSARRKEILLLALILAVGAALRLYGLNWDEGQWIHPDERKIYFVAMELGWPRSLAEALSPESPLNPRFFAYGSLPIYLLKLFVGLLGRLWPAVGSSQNLHLAGRSLAVLIDLGTVYLIYRLACALLFPRNGQGSHGQTEPRWASLFAAALFSVAVLPVQIAHYYTVDTLLAFLLMLALNLAADVGQGGGWQRQVALGVAIGLALATKVSAMPVILVLLPAFSVQRSRDAASIPTIIRRVIMMLAVIGVVWIVVQPYALLDWKTFVDDTIRESQIARGAMDVPYTLQYASTWPFLYSMWQAAFWGVGLPLGLVAWVALAASLIRWLQRGGWFDALLLAWAGPYFVTVALLQTRYLRYVLPLVPVLCILVARILVFRHREGSQAMPPSPSSSGARPGPAARRPVFVFVSWLLILLSLAYTVSLVMLYAVPHPWITASEWLYREVPRRGTLAVEHWDMALPLPLDVDGRARRQTEYDLRLLPLYDEPDDAIKWEALAVDLADTDYLVLASRRLYGSIPRAPDRYPVASRYYELLFAGDLGFELAAEFVRGPEWLNPRIPPLPGAAPALLRPDESFVVYDHPRALIFRNVDRLPAEELLRLLDPLGH